MRLEEYLPTEIARLTDGVRAALDAGDEAVAFTLLQKKLTLMAQVLSNDVCPALDPPATVGDRRWDALVSGALLDFLGDQWPEPMPLAAAWFPIHQTGAAQAETIAATLPILARANVFVRRSDLRWTPATAQLP
ncbi:hypothetical protein [Specibacter sp. RAF43]|uniref:hypothetical protein n=1 Tax=Specibacter sp. RAF43 TaxID=3233057 RepID=UPI003F9E1724